MLQKKINSDSEDGKPSRLKRSLIGKLSHGFSNIAQGDGGKIGGVEKTDLIAVYNIKGEVFSYEWIRLNNGKKYFYFDSFGSEEEFNKYACARDVIMGPKADLETYLKYLK